jgi:hypothetical protein
MGESKKNFGKFITFLTLSLFFSIILFAFVRKKTFLPCLSSLCKAFGNQLTNIKYLKFTGENNFKLKLKGF